MKFNNEQIILDIPPLSNEWVFSAILYYDVLNDCFLLKKETDSVNDIFISRVTLIHTISGDINKFDVVCRDFKSSDAIFEWFIHPIFTEYCKKNNIDLTFEHYLYE